MTTLERHNANTLSVQIPVTLRTATPEDLPKLEWYGQYRHFRGLFRRTFREQQADRRLMLVADVNDFPIGHIFIQLKPEIQLGVPPHAYFYSFRVMEMFRNRGIGTLLMSEAEAQALEHGLEWATIAAAKDNHGARRLYERLGYRVFASDEGSWSYIDHRGRTRSVNEPCWLLEKHLRTV
ncbi:MAG: GNAT family N-acetyltransferase [Anaerolineae bacterium]|nr:GNAT family N-acetyltransferase [Anaerolineae bacterium]